ncbi:MAG: acyl-CoA synthetase [Desulfurococcales archaeon ex4484_217_1]|nr:MAG: acyl-CoA synthetase [Desulfurococcales archaeon ex4484_217_1]
MIKDLFAPRSVAIIGASRNPAKVGHTILRNAVKSGYKGRIYPINPKAKEILGIRCYKTILDVPDEVDLAVIAVPAPTVLDVAEECGEKGVKYLVVISAGFKEIGGEGVDRERKLIGIGKKYGMRILGPNCLGFIDTYTPLNVTFAAAMPRKGRIAFISQSGALITAILDWSIRRGIGFSKIISLGNKADLDETDFIQALGQDENTNVILLYIESIGNGFKFIEAARKVSAEKPIIVVKGGTTEAGAKAAMSHTGAMAGSFTSYSVAFKKSGILLASTLDELFDYALAFSNQPIPASNNIAIVTNAGGPGIITADLSVKHGLRLSSFNINTINKLRSKLPPAAAIYNPVDVLGDARADRYEFAIKTVLSDENVSGLIAILTPQAMTEPLETAKAILRAHSMYPNKPITAAFIGGETVEKAAKLLIENGIPCFDLPERAVIAMKGLCMYRKYLDSLEKEPERIVRFYDVDLARARRIIEKVREEGRKVLLEVEAKELIRAYGIPTPLTVLVRTEDEAVEAANKIGYPVVLKVSSPQILHKTDIGGVVLNINSDREVREAFRTILNRVRKYVPRAVLYGITVQKMVPRGREVIIGVSKDPTFGYLIMFGSGGIYANLFRDVTFRLTPVTLGEVKEMLRETKAYAILKGIRGEPPADISSVINVILRVNQLIQDIPEIVEMDINPLFVYEEGEGCLALDVKIVIS